VCVCVCVINRCCAAWGTFLLAGLVSYRNTTITAIQRQAEIAVQVQVTMAARTSAYTTQVHIDSGHDGAHMHLQVTLYRAGHQPILWQNAETLDLPLGT
jgi:hypothetical protein